MAKGLNREPVTWPDLGPGELWSGRPDLRARLAHLPTFPPFARVAPQAGRPGCFVEGGLVLTCAQLTTPMPVAAALALTHQLAEIFAVLHDDGAGHGGFTPDTVGWTREGTLLVAPDPGLILQPPDPHADSIQARDCQCIGAVLWTTLGGAWPLPEPERNTARLLSPGIPAIVAQALPRISHGDERLMLMLRGLLRWGGGYRLAPARAVRQAVSALRFRHGASEQALAAYLADHGIQLAPIPRRPEPDLRPSLFNPPTRRPQPAPRAAPVALPEPIPAPPAHPAPPQGTGNTEPKRRVTIDIPVQDDFPLIDQNGLFVAPPSLVEDDEPERKVLELQNTLTVGGVVVVNEALEVAHEPEFEPVPVPEEDAKETAVAADDVGEEGYFAPGTSEAAEDRVGALAVDAELEAELEDEAEVPEVPDQKTEAEETDPEQPLTVEPLTVEPLAVETETEEPEAIEEVEEPLAVETDPEETEADGPEPEEAEAEEPDPEEAEAEEPDPEEAEAEEPDPEEAEAEEPDLEEAEAEEPDPEEPDLEEAEAEEPDPEEPDLEEAEAEEPDPEEAEAEEPDLEEAEAEEPDLEEAESEEPDPEEPLAEVPDPEESLAEVPDPEEPLAEVLEPEETLAEVPDPEEPLAEVPDPEEPLAEVLEPEVVATGSHGAEGYFAPSAPEADEDRLRALEDRPRAPESEPPPKASLWSTLSSSFSRHSQQRADAKREKLELSEAERQAEAKARATAAATRAAEAEHQREEAEREAQEHEARAQQERLDAEALALEQAEQRRVEAEAQALALALAARTAEEQQEAEQRTREDEQRRIEEEAEQARAAAAQQEAEQHAREDEQRRIEADQAQREQERLETQQRAQEEERARLEEERARAEDARQQAHAEAARAEAQIRAERARVEAEEQTKAERKARDEAEEQQRKRALAKTLAEEAKRKAEEARIEHDATTKGDDMLGRPASGGDDGTWLAGVGISERHDREKELGAGKWTEPARSLEEVAASMPSDPIREMKVRGTGIPYKLVLLAVGLLALLSWLMLRNRGDEDPFPAPSPSPESLEPSTDPEPTVSPAAADAPEVTIWTDLEQARVELDGRDQGQAPARVSVPLDTDLHELCLVQGEMRTCRELTGEQLAQQDPYAFTIGDTP